MPIEKLELGRNNGNNDTWTIETKINEMIDKLNKLEERLDKQNDGIIYLRSHYEAGSEIKCLQCFGSVGDGSRSCPICGRQI